MNKKAVLKLLKDGRTVIGARDQWTQGYYARDASGAFCQARAPEAVCWCSVGVLMHLVPRNDFRIADALEVLRNEAKQAISNFNDFHTHEEVLAVWDRAIAKLESEVLFCSS